VKRYPFNTRFTARSLFGLIVLASFILTLPASAETWAPIAKDGLRDPKGPGVALIQDPNEGFQGLPPDKVGNKVNWIKAIELGVISPRRPPTPPGEKSTLEQAETIIPEIMLDTKGSMARVLFPHKKHTLWLECANCHASLMGTPAFFEPKLGANDIRMYKILSGEQCGRCHGAVSFPPVNCSRCHSVPHTDLKNDPAAVIPKARP
jgi:c(7)-type cytochrome triheme protein